MGKFLVENSKDNTWLKEHVELHNKIINDAQQSAAKVKQLGLARLSKLSNNGLYDLYADLREKTEKFHALSMEIDAVDIELENQLRARIAKLVGIKREQNEAYAIMTTAAELSYPKKEELLYYKLVLDFQKNKKPGNEKAREINKELLTKLLDEYWWTELNWRAGNIRTVENIKKGVNDIIKQTKDINKHIKQLEKYRAETLNGKEKYLKDKELAVLNDIFEAYALLHDKRKETQLKTTYSIYLILEELAARFKIKVEYLELYMPEKILALIKSEGKNKLDENETTARLGCVTIIIENKKITSAIGKEALSVKEKEFSADIQGIRDFSGLPASLGKAVGKVKIALSAADALSKIEKGDILVTGMTMPDFLPAMKKAAAIITNEGGATCHAAIISREFNIPCTVGTKIATKVLRDGMLVEVNANHGVVKIIK
ncbi:hypothetical protein HYU06_03465 [Candidatus Woesearchaeota archaeon]|nr:hypothetical protein [Candidatus Woesearchaeota archaeon]